MEEPRIRMVKHDEDDWDLEAEGEVFPGKGR